MAGQHVVRTTESQRGIRLAHGGCSCGFTRVRMIQLFRLFVLMKPANN